MGFDFGYGFNPFGGIAAVGVVLTVCSVLGLILGIVLLVVFLPAKNRGKYQGAASWFYDFLNFNKFWITWMLKLLNIIIATVCLLGGFITLFIQPLTGLGLMLGYVVYRMLLELVMVTLNIQTNVSNIDDKLSRLGYTNAPPPIAPAPPSAYTAAPAAPVFPAYTASASAPSTPVPPAQPQYNVCQKCGSLVAPGSSFCMKCGASI